MPGNKEINQRIQELREEIGRLEASLPAHSVPPSMLIRLEDLEEELAQLLQQRTLET
jgi:hypothetical protein